ncbi:MAG TPA: DUF2802 domain-containing protein [Woeseiaceae bacterium]|nr:DUF2802 domain-containing protein [Woeseiaceae bacterium]
MNILDSDIAYLVIVANALLLAAAALAILRFSSQYHKMRDFWRSPTGAAVADDKAESAAVHNLLQATARLEGRMAALQKQVEQLAKTPEAPVRNNVRPLPIDNAVRMARSGASVDDLTRTCGLNIGEARLMQQLHARRAATASA